MDKKDTIFGKALDPNKLTWGALASKCFESLQKDTCTDRLDNTFAANNNDGNFQPTGAVQEGLLLGSEYNEQRTNVTPSLSNYSGAIGQIVSWFSVGLGEGYYVGTGSIQYSYEHDMFFVITWAHNFINKDEGKSEGYSKIKNATIFICRDGESNYSFKIPLLNYFVHPMYFNTLDSGHGYDIAVSSFHLEDATPPISDIEGMKESLLKIVPSFPEPKQHQKGNSIEVIGYPGEKDGRLYKMRGSINKITSINGGNQIVMYTDIDTTGGQSGSPVYKITSAGDYELVGIHVAYINKHDGNFATLITKELKDWLINKLATCAKWVTRKSRVKKEEPKPASPKFEDDNIPTDISKRKPKKFNIDFDALDEEIKLGEELDRQFSEMLNDGFEWPDTPPSAPPQTVSYSFSSSTSNDIPQFQVPSFDGFPSEFSMDGKMGPNGTHTFEHTYSNDSGTGTHSYKVTYSSSYSSSHN